MGLDRHETARHSAAEGAVAIGQTDQLASGRKLRFAAFALIMFLVIPILLGRSPYFITVLTNGAVLSFISMGVWITFSIGRMNLAQGAFALVGGYAAAILSTRYGISFWLCLPVSGLVSAALGAIIGWPVLRLKGVYFAMTTLSLTEAIRLLALNGGDITKGATGIVNIPRPGPISIFGITILRFDGANPLPYYFLACTLLVLGILGVWRLSASRLGWVFRSLRQNEDLATSIGINVAKYRVMAFAICCFMGGIGGAFFAAFHQNIYPATYTIADSVNFMLYCFLGGLAYIFGPAVGAFLLVISFELLHAVQDYQTLIYGLLMIACMLWLPNGILSLGRIHFRQRKNLVS
ncbi:MAG: branched-chain amino acid ABC transporter permease [Verrucomicrobia bacterium]|nr:branched-chain amino acid ABC transporter permease [Verrucomicrobiota bacterium]